MPIAQKVQTFVITFTTMMPLTSMTAKFLTKADFLGYMKKMHATGYINLEKVACKRTHQFMTNYDLLHCSVVIQI
jgi:hypothetical protein